MTIGTSQFAVYDISYTNRVPYITIAEYENAPTAMDVSNLIAGGNAAAQQTSLQETIGRASSLIDQYCCGAYSTLAATQNVENARIWGNNQGQLIIHPRLWPILSVDSFAFALPGQTAASITPAGNCWIEPQQFIIQTGGGTQGWSSLSTQFGGWGGYGIVGGNQYQCQWSYTNGWPTSTLSASVVAGADSITPQSVIGIYPGTSLTIYDLPNDEMCQVASTYVPGDSTVPLVAPLNYAHDSGVMVTNLPPSIKQAAISAVTALIKQRGSGAMIVADIGDLRTIDQSGGTVKTQNADWALAMQLLDPFVMKFVGY